MGDVRVLQSKTPQEPQSQNFGKRIIPNQAVRKIFKLFTAQVKLQRAYGGCLGTDSRRRTCKAAISSG